ncbi:MAG: hypothetical protein KAV98_05330 [Dehalococcoidia bacterium]|nr:hypothetical protein [Dehalococcoidia bacterium]
MKHKIITAMTYFLIGLGIGLAGYVLLFWVGGVIDYSGGMPREEPLPYADIVFYFIYSLMVAGPLAFWIIIPLVKFFKRRRQARGPE